MADLLNPELKLQDPRDYTSASKGVDVNTQGNTGLGNLLSQAGDLFGLAVKATDTAIKEQIEDPLRKGIDQIQNEFGVGDAAKLAQSGTKDVPPSEINTSVKFLERNAQAVKQGTLPMSSYWARLETVSRELRARFPGHRDYIDEQISSMTGSKPANALVRTLHSEAEAVKEKTDKTADREASFIYSNFHYLSPELQAGWKAGRVSNDQAIIAAGQAKGVEQSAQTTSAVIGAKVKAGEYDEGLAYRTLEGNLAKLNDSYKQNLPTALGMSTTDIDKYVSEVAAGTRTPTPEEKQNLTAFVMGARKNAEVAFRAHANKFFQDIGNGVAPNAAKIEASIQANLAEYDNYNKVLTGDAKGISIISQDADRAKAELDSEKVRALRIPLIKRAAIMRETMGDQAYTSLLTGPLKSATERVVHTYMVGGILDKSTKSVSEALQKTRDAFDQTNTKAEVVANRTLATALTSKDTSATDKETLIEAFFGDANRRIMSVVKPDDRKEVLETMTSGLVHNEMASLKDTRPDLWDKYKGFSREIINVEGVKVLNTLNALESRQDNKYYKLEYQNGTFVPIRDTSVMPDIHQVSEMQRYGSTIKNVADMLNAQTAPIRRIAETEKRDPDQEIGSWLSTVGMERLVPLANTTTKSTKPNARGVKRTSILDYGDNADIKNNPQLGVIGQTMKDAGVSIGSRESTNVQDRRGVDPSLDPNDTEAILAQLNYKAKALDPSQVGSFEALKKILEDMQAERLSNISKRLGRDIPTQ